MPDITGSMYRNVLVVVFCFLIRDGYILLNKRGKEPHLGAITVPGGRKEPGETVFQTCEREIKEETNLILLDTHLSGIVSFTSSDPKKESLAIYFRSNRFSGSLKGSSEGEVFWSPLEDSFHLEVISPIYRLLAPFVLDNNKRIFHGLIKLNSEGDIIHHDLEQEKES